MSTISEFARPWDSFLRPTGCALPSSGWAGFRVASCEFLSGSSSTALIGVERRIFLGPSTLRAWFFNLVRYTRRRAAMLKAIHEHAQDTISVSMGD